MKQKVLVAMVTLMATVLAAGLAVAPSTEQAPTNVEFLEASGKINYMRIQQVGDTFGPPSDSVAVEVIIKLDTLPANAFGFLYEITLTYHLIKVCSIFCVMHSLTIIRSRLNITLYRRK